MIDLSELEHEKALGDALERLKTNPDYILLIETEYLRNFPAQLAMALGADNTQHDEAQTRIKKGIDGVGAFSNFINRVRIDGMSATASIKAVDEGEFADDEENY